jgi:hypothetical protein
MYVFIGIVIWLLLVLFLVMVFNTRNIERQLLSGFWTANQSFLDNAGLTALMLYVDEPKSNWSNEYTGYLIMINSSGILINDPVVLSLNEITYTGYTRMHLDERKYELTIKGISYNFFPKKQYLIYNPLKGKLVLENNDKVYAILYKDTASSNLVKNSFKNKKSSKK